MERPFKAVVTGPELPGDSGAVADEAPHWSVDAIEEAYRKALEAAELADLDVPTDLDEPAAEISDAAVEEDSVPRAVAAAEPEPLPVENHSSPVTPRQIVEALLFVGGRPLTGRALADVVGGSTSPEQVEDLIAAINVDYASQGRPYEIHLVEGGYRLKLRADFERVRSRVFGAGPKEVKLSQDALEVLAFVAYRQPVTAEALDETGKSNSSGLLRQLLRRELIALKRDDEGEIHYETTARFLELFGLSSLNDLPQAEHFDRR